MRSVTRNAMKTSLRDKSMFGVSLVAAGFIAWLWARSLWLADTVAIVIPPGESGVYVKLDSGRIGIDLSSVVPSGGRLSLTTGVSTRARWGGMNRVREFKFIGWKTFGWSRYAYQKLRTGQTVSGFALYFPHWSMLVVFGLFPLVRVRSWFRRRRLAKSGRCVRCGYELCGLSEPRCPECGTPFERRAPKREDAGSETT
jgi:hypothetical protein